LAAPPEQVPRKADRYYRKCRCACHVEGILKGKYRHHPHKTRNWKCAAETVRKIEDGKRQKTPSDAVITLKDATDVFLADLAAQNRANDMIRRCKILFSQPSNLGETPPISQFTFPALVKFRSGWTQKGTATKNK
jgi:hypothetical protein